MAEKQPKQKDEKKIHQLYMQFQMAKQQIDEMQKQVQSLEETLHEINESKKGIAELSEKGTKKEILVPIVSGIFTKAELKNTKEFIVNVGGSVAVEKSSEEVQKLLDKQLEEVQTAQNSFMDNLQQLTMNAKKIQAELKDLIEN